MHKVSSLAKRWLLGTHQGSVDEAQGVVHRQGETDYYWLSRTVAYLGELGWSDESV